MANNFNLNLLNIGLPPHLQEKFKASLKNEGPKQIEASSNIQAGNPQLELSGYANFKTEIVGVNSNQLDKSSTVRKNLKFRSKQERWNERLKGSAEVKQYWRAYRKAAGEVWIDPSLEEWDINDYRIFVGDLGNEVTDEILKNAFMKYPSFLKAKVVRDTRNGKSKGFGFVSIKDVEDYIKAMREMQGKYIGNRPVKLTRSKWKDRTITHSNSKLLNWKFAKKSKQALNSLKTKTDLGAPANSNYSTADSK